MNKKALLKPISALLSAALLMTGFAGALMGVFAESPVDSVLPLLPFKVSGGNASAITSNRLFDNNYASAIELSSSELKNGIIANLDALGKQKSGSFNTVTPFYGGYFSANGSAVNAAYTTTTTLTSEKGLKLTASSGLYEHSGNLAASAAFGAIRYTYMSSLAGADGIMFYLKTDGANLVNIELDVKDPENTERWKFDFDPWLMLKLGAEYSYMSADGTAWKSAKAVAREGSEIFGAMQFDAAFEGYVKIPFASLTNDCGFVFDRKQDAFEAVYFRTKGIGGKYGNVTAGPLFILDNDSASKTIKVNTEKPQPAPETISGRVSGFDEELADIKALLLYVKTDSANRISVTADISDDVFEKMPSISLTAGNDVYILEYGKSEWTKTEILKTETVGAIEFDKAFEGYIKIPLDSFSAEGDIAVLPEVDSVTALDIFLAGLGGKFGKVVAAPFLMTEDSGNVTFKISDTYTPPVATKTEVQSIGGAELITPNYETVSHTAVAPLDFSSAIGSQMTSVSSSGYSVADGTLNGSMAFAAFNLKDANISDHEGFVVYVKTESANCFMPMIELTMPSDTSRWNNPWKPLMMLASKSTYEYLPIGETKWQSGTTVEGVTGNAYFGAVKFDSAFEGYIKIPFDSLVTDTGFKFDKNIDTVSGLYYRLKGLGGEHGKVTVGPTFYMVKDGEEEMRLLTEPVEVTPLTNGSTNQGNWQTVFHSEKATLPLLTNEKGVSITLNTDYLNSYEFSGTNLATSMAFASTIYAEKNSLVDTESLLFYLKTDAAGRVMLELYLNIPTESSRWPWSWAPVMALKPGKTYSYMAVDGKKWSTATAVQGRSDATAYTGAMYFDSAFEGYVKVPYSSLVHDDGFAFDPAKDTIERTFIRVEGLGGEKGGLTAGPYFAVNRDGDSADIKIYTEPEPIIPVIPEDDSDKPTKVRIENILKYSKDGVRQGHYIMVGDENRVALGSPVYRLLRETFVYDYSMKCSIVAEKGLTAEKWSGTGVDTLIDSIANDGAGTIVDISLGMNDTEKSAEEIAEYIKTASEKILAARPKTVIVYTSSNITMDSALNEKLQKAAKLIAQDESIYPIDVQGDVFAEYYTQYFADTKTPNIDGFRTIAKYSSTKYFGGNFEKITTTDKATLSLPAGAKLIGDSIETGIKVNTETSVKIMKVDGRFIKGVSVEGTAVSGGTAPFNANNQLRLTLSSDITGSNYVAFRLELPSANRIGISGFREDDNEVIFMKGQKYEVLADGDTEWKEKRSTSGRADDLKTYGSLDFDSAFKGWVRLPMRGFYNTPSTDNKVNNLRFMFTNLGGNYGKINIGPFVSMTEAPYSAPGVWSKSDLPDMVPFKTPSGLNKYWEVMTEFVPSPIPTLSDHKGLYISCDPVIDKEGVDYMQSWYWAELQYKGEAIDEYTHLMFYVKVPDTKENHISLCFFDDTDFEYKVMAKSLYALLPLGENEWQHNYCEDVGLHNYGGIVLPAGFEGFIKLPIASLMPSNIPDGTKFTRISYRFSYIGTEDESVLVGPTFGVTKDNDPGPAEVVYTSLPEPTTIKKMYAIEEGDIFADKVMVYWEEYEDAVSYIIEAYSMTKIEKGFEYRLVSSKTAFTNSGTIGGLDLGTQYAIMIKACDKNGNVIAIYEYTRVKTIRENPYSFPVASSDIVYDGVNYADGEVAASSNVIVIIAIVAGALVLLGGIAAVVIILAKKRRKANV